MNETSSLRRRFGRLASVVMATGLLLWPGGRLAAADLQLSAHLSQAASGLIVDLHLAGSRGQIYEVQASDDLKKWVTVGVGLASASGEVNVQDLGAENYPHRFYRALLVDATTPPQFAVSAGLGLRATVDQGKLTAADGSVIELGGGSVTLLLNTVNYVCLDLFDLQLHVLSRFIHSGAVLVATVTTDAASVKSISQFTVGTLPATRLPKTQHKLNLGQPVQVLLLGDSLTDGFGTEVPARWAQLLFSTNSVTNRWSLLTKAPTLGYRNLGVGGTTARYGMSAVGQIIGPNNQGQRADHPNQAIYRTPYNDARSGESPRTFASPLLSDTPDLLIINFGANTTAGESVFLETTVREFRRKGAEVIIQTGNSRSDGLTPLLDSGATIKGIADAQSCAVADTWAYVHEANDAGLNTYADFVHQNARGYQLYAEATRSVLNDLPQAAAPVSASDDRFTAPTFALPNRVPNITQVQFTPARTTGTRIPVRNPQLSPVVTLGRQNDAVGAIQLNSGQYATYASSRILAVDIIIENQEGEDAS